MIYDPIQSEEIYWLQQRLQYLKIAESMFNEKKATTEDIEELDQKYAKVQTPNDLLQRYREVYGWNIFDDH